MQCIRKGSIHYNSLGASGKADNLRLNYQLEEVKRIKNTHLPEKRFYREVREQIRRMCVEGPFLPLPLLEPSC